MPLAGAVAITPGTPVKLDGRLKFESVDAVQLASLLFGSDLTGPGADGAAWTDAPFAAGTFDGMSGRLALTAGSLRLSPNMPAARSSCGGNCFTCGYSAICMGCVNVLP